MLRYVVTTTIAVVGILVKNWDELVVEVAERNAAEANENAPPVAVIENIPQPSGIAATSTVVPVAKEPMAPIMEHGLPGEVEVSSREPSLAENLPDVRERLI